MNQQLLLRIALGFTVVVFVVFGTPKLIGIEMQKQNFATWGYPQWFMYVAGAIEVFGALLLLYAPTRFYASGVLAGVMVGAAATHIRTETYPMIGLNVVLFSLCSWFAWTHMPTWLATRLGRSSA